MKIKLAEVVFNADMKARPVATYDGFARVDGGSIHIGVPKLRDFVSFPLDYESVLSAMKREPGEEFYAIVQATPIAPSGFVEFNRSKMLAWLVAEDTGAVIAELENECALGALGD